MITDQYQYSEYDFGVERFSNQMAYLGQDSLFYYLIVNYSKVLSYPTLFVMMLMVGTHKLDYRNDVDRAEMVDQQYTEHERFPFSNCVHGDGNRAI